MKYWYTLQPGWTLNTLVKEAVHKESHTVWLYLHKVSSMGKSGERERSVAAEAGREIAGGKQWLLIGTGLLSGVIKMCRIDCDDGHKSVSILKMTELNQMSELYGM